MLISEKILLSAACLSTGVILGFLLSPVKKGVTVTCGNNNTVLPHTHPRGKDERPDGRPAPEPIREENL